jgi:hypothetical protein
MKDEPISCEREKIVVFARLGLFFVFALKHFAREAGVRKSCNCLKKDTEAKKDTIHL